MRLEETYVESQTITPHLIVKIVKHKRKGAVFRRIFVSFSERGCKEMQKVNKQIVFIPQMICSTMKLINWKERRKRSQRKWSKYANISKSFQLKFCQAWILTHVFLFSIIDYILYILLTNSGGKNCIEEKFFKYQDCLL